MYRDVRDLFEQYIQDAQVYENTFKGMLRTIEPSIDSEKLDKLPQNLFLHIKEIVKQMNFSKGRETYITAGNMFGNKFLTEYMDKAVDDFKTNPQGSIDLLDDSQQNSFYGQIYEGVVAGLTSNPEIIPKLLGLENKGKLGVKGVGLGTERHPGDVQMFLYDFDLQKAVDLGSYIEVKYSDDYMQTIASVYSESTEQFATTDQVWEEIYDEIQKGLEGSISANFSTGWMHKEVGYANDLDFLLYLTRREGYNRQIQEEKGYIKDYVAKTTPKTLIYIMKSEGLWLSQLLERMEPIVRDNASYIIQHAANNLNRSRLWYSRR